MDKNLQKDIKWQKIGQWKSSLLFVDFVTRGQDYKYFGESLNIDFAFENFKLINNEVFHDFAELAKLSKIFRERIKKDKNFFLDFKEKCFKRCKDLLDISEKISSLEDEFKNKNNEELEKLFKEYSSRVLKLVPFLVALFPVEEAIEEKILSNLKLLTKDKKLAEGYFKKLLITNKETFITSEHKSILKIACQIQKNPKTKSLFNKKDGREIEEELVKAAKPLFLKLRKHKDRFGWFNMKDYRRQPYSIDYYVKNIELLLESDCQKELNKFLKREETTEKEISNIIKEIGIRGSNLRIINIARSFIYLRSYRIDVLNLAGFKVWKFLDEIALRKGLAYQDIIYLRYPEIINLLEGKSMPSINEIRERQKEYAMIEINREVEIFSGKKLDEYNKSQRIKDYTLIKEVKGTVANKGKAKGLAKIVPHPTLLHKMQKGDILVCPMTNPDYIPGVMKAAAIVTDEGGILCHAAIVSREFGIPCVIGTKIATKVFQDGDLVEVDGGKGVIKKL